MHRFTLRGEFFESKRKSVREREREREREGETKIDKERQI